VGEEDTWQGEPTSYIHPAPAQCRRRNEHWRRRQSRSFKQYAPLGSYSSLAASSDLRAFRFRGSAFSESIKVGAGKGIVRDRRENNASGRLEDSQRSWKHGHLG
jgi:hypothetical protein